MTARPERDRILSQIGQALVSAHLPAAAATLPTRTVETKTSSDSLIASFIREATALRVNVHQPTTSSELHETVISLLPRDGNRAILAWSDSELPSGLGEALRKAGFKTLDPSLPTESVARRTKLRELGQASVGITGALAGLADTGSLALVTGSGRSRLASLLPPTHIALLRTSTILATLPAFFAAHPTVTQTGSNLVFVTGPSRTGDIEMTLVFGVHGPKQLQIVLFDDTRP